MESRLDVGLSIIRNSLYVPVCRVRRVMGAVSQPQCFTTWHAVTGASAYECFGATAAAGRFSVWADVLVNAEAPPVLPVEPTARQHRNECHDRTPDADSAGGQRRRYLGLKSEPGHG